MRKESNLQIHDRVEGRVISNQDLQGVVQELVAINGKTAYRVRFDNGKVMNCFSREIRKLVAVLPVQSPFPSPLTPPALPTSICLGHETIIEGDSEVGNLLTADKDESESENESEIGLVE